MTESLDPAVSPQGIVLDAGAPLETPRHGVGHRSVTVVDDVRDGRALNVDCWYPAVAGGESATVYEILPGIGFTSAARSNAAPIGEPAPLLIWSHGRTGTRAAYTMLCEGLAARGWVVVSADHPGDTLMDWLLGVAADDATNDANRVGDVRFLLDTILRGASPWASDVSVDHERIAVAGHSYGGWTALAIAGADAPDPRVRAVAGLQSLTRTLPKSSLVRVTVPVLLIVGERDTTTPPSTDADRAFALLRGTTDARRVDLAHAAHQACSDVGLYLELAPMVPGLPDVVAQYLAGLADQISGTPGEAWRPVVGTHLKVLGAWLDDVLDRDRDAARLELDALAQHPEVRYVVRSAEG